MHSWLLFTTFLKIYTLLLKHLKTNFHSELKGEYPPEEINSFFNLLMENYLKISRLDLALDPEKEISPAEVKNFDKALQQLLHQKPIQYIIGETEFFGLPFKVNPHVLIPRPETEELVQWVMEDLQKNEFKDLTILDIGTGSGCIAVSLAKNFPQARVSAMDISEEALNCAKLNAERNGVKINFIQQDVLKLDKLAEMFDVIISNPPYVRELEKPEMSRNVLEHEPSMALYVKDEDPLIFYKKITKLAEAGLKKNGNLYFEINQYLAEETKGMVTNNNLKPELRKDIFGNYRMLRAWANK